MRGTLHLDVQLLFITCRLILFYFFPTSSRSLFFFSFSTNFHSTTSKISEWDIRLETLFYLFTICNPQVKCFIMFLKYEVVWTNGCDSRINSILFCCCWWLWNVTGVDEWTGEARNSSERCPRSRRGSCIATPSSLQVRWGLHDGSVNSMEMAPAADTLPGDAPAPRGGLPQLLHRSPKMWTMVHYVSCCYYYHPGCCRL